MSQLLTYRDAGLANPDVTTWTYQDATGLLVSKTYADNKSVSYTYSADGKLATRTWSRGVVTNYAYNLAGDLTGISYSDSTPAVGFTYNRLGQQLTVTDAVGSRTFGYSDKFQLTSETINGIYNKTLTRSYDTLGRSSGMNIGTEYAVGYGYDNLGRFSTVTNGADTFTYGYLANSNLISSITYPNNISVTKTYEANRDLVTQVSNKYNSTVVSNYDYSNDDLGRRTAMGKSGTAFTQADTISYGYNGKSEVTSAVSANITTQNWGYAFDPIGNRITSSNTETGTEVQTSYATNNVNQYASTTEDQNPAVNLTYNNDGCITNDGSWTFGWDAMNQLISAEKTGERLEFAYDYQGRRVEKKVFTGSTGNWTLTQDEKFIYNGWNLLEVFDAMNSNTITKQFAWGLDLSQTRHGAGGVGGLVSMTDVPMGNTYYYLYDANGNVEQMLTNMGMFAAKYVYSPYGKGVQSEGLMVGANPFRFSTKYKDDETGLIYYGYRYHSPTLGRWLSRDPINEVGSMRWWQDNKERIKLHKILKSTERQIDSLILLSSKNPEIEPQINDILIRLKNKILFIQYEIILDLQGRRNNGNNDNPYSHTQNNPVNHTDGNGDIGIIEILVAIIIVEILLIIYVNRCNGKVLKVVTDAASTTGDITDAADPLGDLGFGDTYLGDAGAVGEAGTIVDIATTDNDTESALKTGEFITGGIQPGVTNPSRNMRYILKKIDVCPSGTGSGGK